MNILVGVMLTVCAIEDWQTKKISIWWPAATLLLGAVIRLTEGTLWSWDSWLGLLVGAVFFALAMISREQLGKGDAIVLMACGFCLGWKRLLSLVLGAVLLFLVVGVIRLLWKKLKRKSPVAFVPFLYIVFLLSLICFSGE